jgi:hypothetical protein
MKFNILKVDCNRDIWDIKGANCYPYLTYPLGACMEWEFELFVGNPHKRNSILLLFWGLIEGIMSKKI